jgi:hypothetical protein
MAVMISGIITWASAFTEINTSFIGLCMVVFSVFAFMAAHRLNKVN